MPDEFWANDSGLALHYVMSATVKDPSIYGPEHVGKKWSVEVMSFLRFDGDRVCFEADFHDQGSRARSLGISTPPSWRSPGAAVLGSSSCSPGVNCHRPVQTRRRNRHPAGVRTTTSS